MPALTYPDQTEINLWGVTEQGVRDGSSPVDRLEINASSSERVFRCNWDYRANFIQWMLGYGETWDDAGTTRLSRLLPQVHPYYPDLIATKVTQVKGFKWTGNEVPDVGGAYSYTDQQLSRFDKAEVTVLYEHRTFDLAEDVVIYDGLTEFDRYVVRGDVQPGAEYLQLPGAALKYKRSSGSSAPNDFPIPFSPGKILPQERFTLTWHRVPENVWTPDSGLYDYVYGLNAYAGVPAYGAINKTTFYGRPPGTVLLENLRPILLRSPLGIGWEYDIEYHFAFNPRGWNYLYHWDPAGTASGWYFVTSGSYEAPGSVTNDKSIYNEREFSNLFSVNN